MQDVLSPPKLPVHSAGPRPPHDIRGHSESSQLDKPFAVLAQRRLGVCERASSNVRARWVSEMRAIDCARSTRTPVWRTAP